MTETPYNPITPNPFLTGAPVPTNSDMFFGREDDFVYVKQRLLAEEEGIVMLLVGARRSGKTSIMFQILNGKLGDQFLPVFIDMQLMAGVTGDREFFERTAAIILDEVKDDRLVLDYYNFAEGSPSLTFDQLLEDLQQIYAGKRIIFLIDEAEILQSKINKEELTSHVLTYMASILERRQISFCFTGSPGLSEATGEEWRRLTGKGDAHEVGFFSEADSRLLIEKPVEGRVRYGEGVVDTIYKLTYGHPYYTQMICSYAVDHLNHNESNDLSHQGLEDVVRLIIDNPPPQLVYQWDDLEPNDRLTLAIAGEICAEAGIPVSAESLRQAIRDNKYPVELRTESIRVALENLNREKWLEREGDQYHFKMDLFRQWLRRTRTIWSLVESGDVEKPRGKGLLVGIAAGVVAVVAAGTLWLTQSQDEELQRQAEAFAMAQPTTGQLWVDAEPREAELWVDGQRETRSLPTMLDLDVGVHKVELRHADFATHAMDLSIEAGKKDSLQPTLARLMGLLTVEVSPAGAKVEISGVMDTSLAAPFADLALPTGSYKLQANHKGYVGAFASATLVDGVQSAVRFDLRPNVGHLFVTSNPPGAEVRLDGRKTGAVTPYLFSDLSVASHRVQLALEDYQPQDLKHAVQLDQTDTLSADLAIVPAHLILESDPQSAEVFLNDEAWMQTPIDAAIAPGDYAIRIVHEGYRQEMLKIQLRPGQQYDQSFALQRYQGQLRIHGYYGYIEIIEEATNQIVKTLEQPDDVTLPVGIYIVRHAGKQDTVKVVRDQKTVVKLN